ncbi:RNA polymerase sigma factor [Anaerotignum neopropionicum]|nr:hypothetical protein [Anaerotignum neopropionicum]
MQRQELKSAVDVIKSCTPVQQRRFYLNRILGYSFTEIARKERCSEGAVRLSINKVLKIRKNKKIAYVFGLLLSYIVEG